MLTYEYINIDQILFYYNGRLTSCCGSWYKLVYYGMEVNLPVYVVNLYFRIDAGLHRKFKVLLI